MVRKLKNYYQNINAPVKASMWFLICGFLQKAIAMLTTPVFTRIMLESEYGRYSVYNSWLSILQIIITLNLSAGVYTRGLIKNEDDQDRFSSSMLGLNTTCIAVGSVIYIIFRKMFNSLLNMTTVLMASMILEIWATTAFQFWSNRERVNYKYKKLVAITMGYVLLRPAMGVLFVFLVEPTYQVEARVLTTLLVNLILFVPLYISISRKGKQFFRKEYWIYALKFNLPLLPHYLSQIVLNQSDRLMIDKLCGKTETAYYTVAYTLAVVLQILNTSISGTMNPWIYKSIKNDQTDKIANVSYSVLILIAVANFGVIAVAPEVLSILAPESYQAAVWIIPPVTMSVYFMFLYNLFTTFEYYFEKTVYVMIASVLGAVFNIILNLIFIPRLGFVAAGYTTLICYILYAVAHYIFMNKVCKTCLADRKIYDIKKILAIGFILMICSFAVMPLYKFIVVRYVLIIIMMIVIFFFRRKIIGTIEEFKKNDTV